MHTPQNFPDANERKMNPYVLENDGYRLSLHVEGQSVIATLQDKISNLILAQGPMVYRIDAEGHENPTKLSQIKNPQIEGKGRQLTIKGQLNGVDLEQTFSLPANKAFMEETIKVVNHTSKTKNIPDFECGFTLQLTDNTGAVINELKDDRWIAVPLRKRADDPTGYLHDYSMSDIVNTPGYEPHPGTRQETNYAPSRHRWSEGWAWTHGPYAFSVSKFCQENLLFSVLSTSKTGKTTTLRYGGACQMMEVPADLHRMKPGQTVNLGLNRYETFKTGYTGALYGFRNWLDSKGCRFPADFNPPIHWEQLYDMPGAWDNRDVNYTKAIVDKEAQKGREYSCEAIYLDPGWDTTMASFLWGEKWLGPLDTFIKDMKSKYGLDVSLHCPLAPWMSCSYPMGPSARDEYPKAAYIKLPRGTEGIDIAPAIEKGHRNLALNPRASVRVSSTIPGFQIHIPKHLNDGLYGNSYSWIPDSLPAWAEIDLGAEFEISKVRVGNDRLEQLRDRRATSLRVSVATQNDWKEVATYQSDEGLGKSYAFEFNPVKARKVRIEILNGTNEKDVPRLDEIEIFEAKTIATQGAKLYEKQAVYGTKGYGAGPQMCQGSKQYLDTAEKRLLDLCSKGVVFLMFDGNWWSGPCVDPNHGHPIPYTLDDHINAVFDLAKRVKAKYPKVLIEMHDAIVGGAPWRLSPIYYKYDPKHTFDDNWGFELMWDTLTDLRSGRAHALYYYNMGCNVPAYLHITLKNDSREAVVLWWFSSTCRHLGIGGTSPDPEIVNAQKLAMKTYKQLEAYFKRGDFYGINEEIHIHVYKGQLVVNAFNLSDNPRTISGSIDLKSLGLDPKIALKGTTDWVKIVDGRLEVNANMNAWGAKVQEFKRE